MSKRTKKAITGVERADEKTHAQRLAEIPERPERKPDIPPAQAEQITKLIEAEGPESFTDNDKLSMIYGFSTRIYWRCEPTDLRASVWLGWDKSRRVLVGVQYSESIPHDLRKVGNLILRISTLADDIQVILNELPPTTD